MKKSKKQVFTLIECVGQALPDNALHKGHLAGFTLIELLVVVLIIGILAAVAVAQYRRVITQMYFQELRNAGQKIIDAQAAYRLETGNNAANPYNLDITFPNNANFSLSSNTYGAGQSYEHYYTFIQSKKLPITLALQFRKTKGHVQTCWRISGDRQDLKNLADKLAGKKGSQTSYYEVCEFAIL